jgi:hypothetical protein
MAQYIRTTYAHQLLRAQGGDRCAGCELRRTSGNALVQHYLSIKRSVRGFDRRLNGTANIIQTERVMAQNWFYADKAQSTARYWMSPRWSQHINAAMS